MKKLALPLAVITFGLALATASDARRELNSIAVVVNGKPITKSELAEARKANEQMIRVTTPPGPEQNRKLREAREKARDQLIERELILTEFEKLGGAIKPQMIDEDIKRIIRERFDGSEDKFISELKKTGMSMQKFRELRRKVTIQGIMRRTQSRDIVFATPEQVQATYEKNKDAFRSAGSVDVSMITISKFTDAPGVTTAQRKKFANDIHRQISGGESFAEAAKKYSEDPRAEKGGHWGVVTASDKNFRKDLKAIAFSLKTGQISHVVEDNYNFYILRANSRKLGAAKTMSDPKVKEAVNQMALGELKQEAVDRWLKHLKRNARIKVFK